MVGIHFSNYLPAQVCLKIGALFSCQVTNHRLSAVQKCVQFTFIVLGCRHWRDSRFVSRLVRPRGLRFGLGLGLEEFWVSVSVWVLIQGLEYFLVNSSIYLIKWNLGISLVLGTISWYSSRIRSRLGQILSLGIGLGLDLVESLVSDSYRSLKMWSRQCLVCTEV